MALPSSIPNLEVKHIIADNTAGFPGGNVGRCQLFRIFMKLYLSLTLLGYGEAFFYGYRSFMRCGFYKITNQNYVGTFI